MAGRSEPFELELLGGGPEAIYRRMRPEVEALPWHSLDAAAHDRASVDEARLVWTFAAFQEHRTGAACAATLQALITSRAPLDLIAMAAGFPVDEMVHVEMCSRLAMQLGGAARLNHDPDDMVTVPPRHHRPTLRCAELVVRAFCVGEAVSIPLLREAAEQATHPLLHAMLSQIAQDEAAHGSFGWIYLDWAEDQLDAADRAYLSSCALDEIRKLESTWAGTIERARAVQLPERLGWLPQETYLASAYRSLEDKVKRPLSERGLYAAA